MKKFLFAILLSLLFLFGFRKDVCLKGSSLPLDKSNIPTFCDCFLKVTVLFFVVYVGVWYIHGQIICFVTFCCAIVNSMW